MNAKKENGLLKVERYRKVNKWIEGNKTFGRWSYHPGNLDTVATRTL